MIVGKIKEIWRYPVKTMMGEKLDSCSVQSNGLRGDRLWALRDEVAGEIINGKRWPLLMQCAARFRHSPEAGGIPHVEIVFPDGERIASDDNQIDARISRLLERAVTLWPLQPATNRAHYKRNQPGSFIMSRISANRLLRPYVNRIIELTRLDDKVREMFSREQDEPIPDFANIPAELFEYASPPGSYFDAFPIHLLTTASLATMSRHNPSSAWDARRFRPNFLIETAPNIGGLVEASWPGQLLRIGPLKLKIEMPTVRCGMTTYAQLDLPKDPAVLRTIVKCAHQNLGAYASVCQGGVVKTGDSVELILA